MQGVLDCHTASTALESLSGIFRIKSHRLAEILDDYVIQDKLPGDHQEPAEQVLHRVLRESGTPSVDSTHWFHATRATNVSVFRDGLLPLGYLIDTIWDDLFQLAPESVSRSSWDELRLRIENGGDGGRFGNLYRLKTREKRCWGPFAFLVRDAILDAKRAGHHDYLWIPEIVEDIATCAMDRFGWDLATGYREATMPIIVKFAERGCVMSNVRSALYYCYCHRKRLGQSTMTNTCFDAAANPIGPDRILAIEPVVETPCRTGDRT